MDGENEEFQDAMAGCTELALATRRALGCLSGSWRRKVRAGFLAHPELKVCIYDCQFENADFILNLVRPDVHEDLVLRIADRHGDDLAPTIPVRKLLYPALCSDADWASGPVGNVVVPFEIDEHGAQQYRLQTHKPGVGYMGRTAAYFIGRLLAHNDDYVLVLKKGGFFRDITVSFAALRCLTNARWRQVDQKSICMMEWALLAGPHMLNAAQRIKNAVAAHLAGSVRTSRGAFNLSHACVDCDGARRICDMFVALRDRPKPLHVRELDLTATCTPLSLGVIGHLARAETVLLPHLVRIDLGRNKYFGRRSGVGELVRALKRRTMRPLKALLLDACDIIDENFAQLALCFPDALSGLEELSLKNNHLTKASLDCLTNATRDGAPLPMLDTLVMPGGFDNQHSETTITREEWSGMARFLEVYSHAMPLLKKITIHRNGYDSGHPGWDHCAGAIKQALGDERRQRARNLARTRQIRA